MGSHQQMPSRNSTSPLFYSNVPNPFPYGQELHSMANFEDGIRTWPRQVSRRPSFPNVPHLNHIPVEEDLFQGPSAEHSRTPVCPTCGSRLLPESTVLENLYFHRDSKRSQSGFKRRIVWTVELEHAFQTALASLGPRATAKPILEFLEARGFGLTRFQVASHLQKDRKRKQRATTN